MLVTRHMDAPPSTEPPLWRTATARATVALSISISLIVAYNLVGRVLAPERARSIGTALDDAIPFVPWTVLLYSWVYTSMLLPLFAIRSPALFRRTVVAYLVVIAVSLATFVAWPVSGVALRPDHAALDTTTFVEWGVRLTYAVDPPYNLFPSLHLSIAVTSALAVWRARPAFGLLAGAVAACIAVSILTMKQHFIADGVAALCLAGVVWWFVVRPFRDGTDGPAAYSWRGPLAWLAFHCAVYAGLYGMFRAGYTAW